MGARSLRIKQEKLQRARRVLHELPSSVSSPPMPTSSNTAVAYPPIFISPSISFDPFSPSPSPLPGSDAGAVQHHSVPTAAIVGGGIAGVVALAATATIISAVAGKVGLSCLLGPICKLLSGFTGKFIEPCTGRLKSLRNTLNKWNPASKRRISDDDEAGPDHMDLYSALGGSPTNAESAAAAAHSLAQSPLRDVVKGQTEHLEISAHAFLATNVSDFAESQLKKQKEMMLQPLNQNIAKAQGYAESFFSVADNVSDDLRSLKQSADAHLNEVSKLKANANRVKVSTEMISAVWKQPGNAALSMFEETIEVGGGKAKNTIAKENAEGKQLGITSNREADEFEEAELKEQVCIVESASDAFTELQVEEMGAHKHETGGVIASGSNNMALVPTQYAGGNATSQAAGTLVTVPTKAMTPAGRTMTSASKGMWAQDNNDVMQKAGKVKRKRPSNLGHVSFSCEMSAHRLRFFTACRTGGTYGSPPASPADHTLTTTTNNIHHNNHNNNSLNYNDHSLIRASDNYYSNSHPTNYHAPLYNASASASHFNLMHQQYHPSQSIVVQHDTQSPTLTHHTPLEVIHNKSPSNPSIHDYGTPFDGVL